MLHHGSGCRLAILFLAGMEALPAAEIWQPVVNTTWQWQIQFKVNTSFDVQMYDIDLFDVSTDTIAEIQGRNIAVMCYFSAGTRESWRDDADDFPKEALGAPLEEWDGEVWVDVNNEGIRDVMVARLDLAMTKGCDGVEPDNVQVYEEGNLTGVNVTADQQLDYSIFLATEAHKRNLSIGLKNDLRHLEVLEPYFDWAINESCMEYDECYDYTTTFIAANKAVFHTEYDRTDLSFCEGANAMSFSSLLKSWDLGPARCSCQDPMTNDQCDLLLTTGNEYTSYTSSSSSEEKPAPISGARARYIALGVDGRGRGSLFALAGTVALILASVLLGGMMT